MGGEAKLDDPVLSEVFDMWWPRLEEQIGKVLSEHAPVDGTGHRPDRELLQEILELTRLNSRKRSGPIDVPTRLVTDLVSGVRDAMFGLVVEDPKQVSHALTLLERAIYHLVRSRDASRSDFSRLRELRKELEHSGLSE